MKPLPPGLRKEDYFRARVIDAQRISPHMIRVRFGGEGLATFPASPHADERIRIAFPDHPREEPPAPTFENGAWGYHDQHSRDQVRSYTVRRWLDDPRAMDVDFVVHAGGVAATWAARARAGDSVTVTRSNGWYAPPPSSRWQFLIADMTGLPAVERIVEELSSHARVHVLIEVIDGEDVRRLPERAGLEQTWYIGSGHGQAPSALPDAVRATPRPPGDGYVWFAGEAADARAVRKHVRQEWGLAHEQFDILGYWQHRKEQWRERYKSVESELLKARAQAIADGKTPTEILELYDEELERRGL